MNQRSLYSKRSLKILRSGDPRTLFHDHSPADILKRLEPPHRLLSSSAKVNKCQTVGVLARVLYLTPGIFCPAATPGCLESCLGHTSGRMQFRSHAANRDARTALLVEQHQHFLQRLRAELTLLQADALRNGLQPAVRLNGTSDLTWERLEPSLFVDFPDIQFFDYTKLYGRMSAFLDGTFPFNYHLTFSVDAQSKYAANVLSRGGNVAAVFWPAVPNAWWSCPVIDGDAHDARFRDPAGVVVGLRAKGFARVDTLGFTIRPCVHCGPTNPEMNLTTVSEDSHRTTTHQCDSCGAILRSRWILPQTYSSRRSAA